MSSPPPLRWWGWGERIVEPPEGLQRLLHDEVGVDGEIVSQAPALDAVVLPASGLHNGVRAALTAICGDDAVRDDHEERVRHAAGRSYLDLLTLRSCRLPAAPDCVVHPHSASEVLQVLRECSEHRCAVVPFGGGTSVVGGVAPVTSPCIALDTDRMDAMHDVDATNMLATLGAGMRGPRIEAALRRHGMTLGHFPQSFEYVTAGGCAATRSAGQASAGYGRFDEMVRGISFVTPNGELSVPAQPAAATGPSLLQAVLGSEGALGVITDVAVRVRALPRLRRYVGWSFPEFASGTEALRELAQNDALPEVARLSDEQETRVALSMSGGATTRCAQRYLALRGQRAPCLVIVGWEGDGWDVGRRGRRSASLLRRHGGIALGAAPGRSWLRERFAAPYLRDALLDRGVLVETVETAATWNRLSALRTAVTAALREALRSSGNGPIVGCHMSHVYREGASLYFTVLARQAADAFTQWRLAKAAATEAIVAQGGVLSHHHGVGRDHAVWLERTVGAQGTAALRALKKAWDPAGVMNPGVLL